MLGLSIVRTSRLRELEDAAERLKKYNTGQTAAARSLGKKRDDVGAIGHSEGLTARRRFARRG